MNRNEQRRGRRYWRIGASVAVVVVSASAAAVSGLAAPSEVPATTAAHVSSTARGLLAASLADQATATTGGSCPPNSTYPAGPTDETQYGVPFTADIMDGTVNVGYNEDSGAPGTKPLTTMPWFPWMLHVTGLRGTVSGCVPLPGLSLAVQPANLHINTYGYMQGPNKCSSSKNGCSLAPHASATFSYTGIADPGQPNLPMFLTGNSGGELANVAGVTTLHYRTTPASVPGLQVSNPIFTEEWPYPGTGPVKKMNMPAGSAPGAKLTIAIYSGVVTVTNRTASTVTSVAGEESAGFISGPSTLAPYGSKGDTATYTFSFEGSSYGYLPDEQAIPLSFSGEGSTGLVEGSANAYFTVPSLMMPSLEVSDATINGQNAMTGSGPEVPTGSVFNGTVKLTNSTSSTVTGIFGETSQAVQLLATLGFTGVQAPPLVLGGFSLKVTATKPLAATVVGARPDAFGATPNGALDSTATASAYGVLFAASPALACAAPVTTTVTTGTSTVVPVSPAGDPAHPAGSQWTVKGEPISGALTGATARLVSNSFSLQVPLTKPPGYTLGCGTKGAFAEAFNWEIGGVQPNGYFYNCPHCTSYGRTGQVDAGAGRGEAQVEIDVMLTSVGGLATCRPSTTTPVACGG